MAPVRRRMFTFASVVSLLLCVATVVLWVRSYFASDSLIVTHHSSPYIGLTWRHHRIVRAYRLMQTTIEAGRGCIGIDTSMEEFQELAPAPLLKTEWGLSQSVSVWPTGNSLTERLGFAFIRDTAGAHHVIFPLWPLVLMLLILPMVREGQSIRRRHRQASRRCVTCGYNLTGNTSGVCPECGTAVQPQEAKINFSS